MLASACKKGSSSSFMFRRRLFCIASLIEVKDECPTEEAAVQDRRIRQSAQTVVKNVKSPSNQQKEDQSIVEIVTRSIEADKEQFLR